MEAILGFLKGKKTYLVAATLVIMAALKAKGIEIPEEAWAVLAALGLGFIRAAVKKVEEVKNGE